MASDLTDLTDLLLLQTPFQPLTVVILYLLFVLKLGPNLMKNREPFKLKPILSIYNSSQIIINASFFFKLISVLPKVAIICQLVDESEMELAPTIMNLYHRYLLLKLYDFWDTIFFILRKKQRQITFLHIFHHSGVFLFAWIGNKYFPVSQQAPAGSLVAYGCFNTLVHAVMYTYYLFTSLGLMDSNNVWLKKYVTLLQLVQHFTLSLLLLASLFSPTCPYNKEMLLLCLVFLVTVMFLFLRFYKETYNRRTIRHSVH